MIKYAVVGEGKVEHLKIFETDDIEEFIYRVIDEARDYCLGETVRQKEDGTIEAIFSK